MKQPTPTPSVWRQFVGSVSNTTMAVVLVVVTFLVFTSFYAYTQAQRTTCTQLDKFSTVPNEVCVCGGVCVCVCVCNNSTSASVCVCACFQPPSPHRATWVKNSLNNAFAFPLSGLHNHSNNNNSHKSANPPLPPPPPLQPPPLPESSTLCVACKCVWRSIVQAILHKSGRLPPQTRACRYTSQCRANTV